MKGLVNFCGNISFTIRDERRIRFWEIYGVDCEDILLQDEFPSIYRVSGQREVIVQQIRETEGEDMFAI